MIDKKTVEVIYLSALGQIIRAQDAETIYRFAAAIEQRVLEELREQKPIGWLCKTFFIPYSELYEYDLIDGRYRAQHTALYATPTPQPESKDAQALLEAVQIICAQSGQNPSDLVKWLTEDGGLFQSLEAFHLDKKEADRYRRFKKCSPNELRFMATLDNNERVDIYLDSLIAKEKSC